ncbi:MAG: hypothetical protein C0602_02850 [Denitrovibrio sp.]|nr:MAG: hypothetical protein C0602_02850 [Denitrovibrio sp.]
MSVNIEESLCAQCVHFRRLIIEEMKVSFTLKCAAKGRYLKAAKKSCDHYEPMTWEMFLEPENAEAENK